MGPNIGNSYAEEISNFSCIWVITFPIYWESVFVSSNCLHSLPLHRRLQVFINIVWDWGSGRPGCKGEYFYLEAVILNFLKTTFLQKQKGFISMFFCITYSLMDASGTIIAWHPACSSCQIIIILTYDNNVFLIVKVWNYKGTLSKKEERKLLMKVKQHQYYITENNQVFLLNNILLIQLRIFYSIIDCKVIA